MQVLFREMTNYLKIQNKSIGNYARKLGNKAINPTLESPNLFDPLQNPLKDSSTQKFQLMFLSENENIEKAVKFHF